MSEIPSHSLSSRLREQAEAVLARTPSAGTATPSAQDILHELRLHQIALELRNEELRRMQAALEDSRDRYRDLYELAPVGYLTLTRDGQIASVNLTGAALLRQERAELLHLPFAHVVGAQDEDRWRLFFLDALQQGELQTSELSLRRADGSEFHARLDCLRTEAEPSALRITLTDITERWRAEQELRSREDRLRLAKTATGLGIYDRDILSGSIDWDERMREIWGLDPDEPITHAAFMAGVHPDDRAATQAAFDRALDPLGTGEYCVEYRVLSRADGKMRHVKATGQAFFERGRAVRLIGMVRDISAQKRLERQMQERRSEMELLVDQQVAAQTAAAIAHELNQPLVSISAYSEAALRILRNGTKQRDKLARALEGAVEQAQRAGRTLHELLAFLHKAQAPSEPVDLNAVVREAIAIAGESGYSGFRPVVELESGLPPVLANRLQIQKVLLNLVHNGVEAMRLTGAPTAAVTIKVQTMTGKDMAQVTVQDSGPGLDPNTARRVFEPFFTTKTEGIGLGLAISRALVEAHGGQLWADRNAGPGATFHFTLPFAP